MDISNEHLLFDYSYCNSFYPILVLVPIGYHDTGQVVSYRIKAILFSNGHNRCCYLSIKILVLTEKYFAIHKFQDTLNEEN